MGKWMFVAVLTVVIGAVAYTIVPVFQAVIGWMIELAMLLSGMC